MMWSDICIMQAQQLGKINISPFNEDNIQPNSIDLTLDDKILVWDNYDEEFVPCNLDGKFYLLQGDFILASTKEKITLGNGVCAQVDGKSSWGRKGLTIHQTAGFIDAGFSGNITLECTTVGQPIKLEGGKPICQLVFWDAYPSERPYGSEGLNSHYQNQKGVTRSYL